MSWLLPSNRRLRHVEGISLRNLTLTKPLARPHSRTFDDDSIPTSLTTSTKLLAQSEVRALEHSRSSTDLASQVDGNASSRSRHGKDGPNGLVKSPPRPKQRRCSTLNWANENPESRQKLLEDAVVERRVDSFFSLHRREDDGPPLYVSELKEQSMNPDFKSFSLRESGTASRDDTVVVRVWAGAKDAETPTLLLEAEVFLPSLVRVGKTLEAFYHPLPDNCVVFYMTDGIYTSFFDFGKAGSASDAVNRNFLASRSSTFPPRETSSFDALMQLRNLAECIDDAVQTQATVTKQIEEIIQKRKSDGDPIASSRAAKESADSVEAGLVKTQRSLAALRAEKQKRDSNLEARRTALGRGREEQQAAERTLHADEAVFHRRVEQHQTEKRSVNGQIRRIAEQLLEIFPIEPIQDKPLCFTIQGLFLPNAKAFEGESLADGDATCAALGHVAQIVALLESTLEVALPYPISFRGSTSSIFDPLSPAGELGGAGVALPAGALPTPANSAFRVFALHARGVGLKRFRAAVYLLNKDIEELMSKHGLRVMDPRNTLANLKYLLAVLAAGQGEIPKRKAGEIRVLSPRTWPLKTDSLGVEAHYREVSPLAYQHS